MGCSIEHAEDVGGVRWGAVLLSMLRMWEVGEMGGLFYLAC